MRYALKNRPEELSWSRNLLIPSHSHIFCSLRHPATNKLPLQTNKTFAIFLDQCMKAHTAQLGDRARNRKRDSSPREALYRAQIYTRFSSLLQRDTKGASRGELELLYMKWGIMQEWWVCIQSITMRLIKLVVWVNGPSYVFIHCARYP